MKLSTKEKQTLEKRRVVATEGEGGVDWEFRCGGFQGTRPGHGHSHVGR